MRLVLLHGASGNGSTWRPVLPHFGSTDVEAPDLPGRGASPGPAHDDVAATAAWLGDALGASGRPPPVLLGHSYGGAVALQLALDRPELVRGVALVSSASRLRVHPMILEAVAASTSEAPYRLDAAFGPDTPREVLDGYADLAGSTPPTSALADWNACNGFDVRERLGEVSVPVLVLHGSEDALTPSTFQAKLVEALPDATRQVVPGRGHMLPWEDPAAMASAVLDWAGRLP